MFPRLYICNFILQPQAFIFFFFLDQVAFSEFNCFLFSVYIHELITMWIGQIFSCIKVLVQLGILFLVDKLRGQVLYALLVYTYDM